MQTKQCGKGQKKFREPLFRQWPDKWQAALGKKYPRAKKIVLKLLLAVAVAAPYFLWHPKSDREMGGKEGKRGECDIMELGLVWKREEERARRRERANCLAAAWKWKENDENRSSEEKEEK